MSSFYQIPVLYLVALCHVVVIYNISGSKYTGSKFAVYAGVYVMAFGSIGGCVFALPINAAVAAYMVIVVLTFGFACFVSRGSISKKSFLFISYFCLFSALDNSLKIIIDLTLPDLSEPMAYYMAVSLRSVLLLLLLVLYKKYGEDTFKSASYINSKRWWSLALIAALFYIAQAALSIVNAAGTLQSVILLVLFAVISFIMCLMYNVVFSNISYMKKEKEAALIHQNAEYLSAQLDLMQRAEEDHRRLRHDMRHHLETIAGYAKAGDTAAVLDYIGEYRAEVMDIVVERYSINPTINSILSFYSGKTKAQGIDFTVKCSVPAQLSVGNTDLIAILGNLLENALNGCRESGKEEPYVDIHIRNQSRKLMILCDNVCSDSLKLYNGLPSGKSVGISSILAVCDKYKGSLDYRLEDGSCSVCVILNL